MKRQIISTDKGPRTGLPYSQAVRHGDLVFVAGQVALDPATGQVVEGDIGAQTRQTLENVEAILRAAGTSLAHAVECLCLLSNIGDFGAFNEVYRGFFPKDPPARTTVQVVLPASGPPRGDPGGRRDATPGGGARREAGPPGSGQAAAAVGSHRQGEGRRRTGCPSSGRGRRAGASP